MDINNIYPVVLTLVLIGLLAGVGVLILDKMGTSGSVYRDTEVHDESIAIASQAGTVSNVDGGVTEVPYFGNTSINCVLDSDPACGNFTSAGAITTNASFDDGSYIINYTYKANSTATDALHQARDAVAEVPEDWMSLIVTIGILAVILGLVIASFAFTRRR